MGLFDFFTAEGKLKRHVRRVADRDVQAEDRDASARWLVDNGSEQAILGLLGRFDTNLSQQTKDAAEKEQIFQFLVSLGDKVVDPTREHIRRCKQFVLPLRLLEHFRGPAAANAAALELLEAERSRSAFYPEKKKNLLVWIAERADAAAAASALHFLADFDEDVRYAAAEVLMHHADPAHRLALLGMLVRPEEDSNRIKHRVCEFVRSRGWSADGVDLAGRLPAGFAVDGDRIVAR